MVGIRSSQGVSLAKHTAERRDCYPTSGEINLLITVKVIESLNCLANSYAAQGSALIKRLACYEASQVERVVMHQSSTSLE